MLSTLPLVLQWTPAQIAGTGARENKDRLVVLCASLTRRSGDVGTTPACLSFWDISTRPYVPFLERDRQRDESQRQSTAAISMG